jgi:predicted nucleotidyltransferase component of viral defense system
MRQRLKNVSASVRARLNNLAKESGQPFLSVLLRYVQERFLYRLSVSKHADRFVLKGGLLLYGAYGFKFAAFRPSAKALVASTQ